MTDTWPTPAGARHSGGRPAAPVRRTAPETGVPRPGPAHWMRAVVGGWSFAPGVIAITGVTFPAALGAGAAPVVDIRIVNSVNTAGDPVVFSDSGFAPDAEGFTLAVCAAEPGPFLAEVAYSHLGARAEPPQTEGESLK